MPDLRNNVYSSVRSAVIHDSQVLTIFCVNPMYEEAHWANHVVSTLNQREWRGFSGVLTAWFDQWPANMRHWPNAGLLLVHRLRRWPSSKPALGQRLMFAGWRVCLTRQPQISSTLGHPLLWVHLISLMTFTFFKHVRRKNDYFSLLYKIMPMTKWSPSVDAAGLDENQNICATIRDNALH